MALAAACAARVSPIVVPSTEVQSVPTAPLVIADPGPSKRESKIVTGLGQIEIGMPIPEVKRRIGAELRRHDFDTERAAFTSFNYDVSRTVPFILGFDEVLVFNDDTLRSEPPIWKVYAKGDRVVMLKITTVGFEDYLREHKTGFPPSCFLLAPTQGIAETFGSDYEEEDLADHVTFHFFERGVSVMTFDDAIRVFDVYGDVGDDMRAKLHAAIAKPAP